MNRRGFFGLFAAAAATAIAVPELELLVPKRTIFLPPAGGWRVGNQLLNAKMISEEALRVLTMNMYFQPGDVRRYGAVGDGITDDSAAIQRAARDSAIVIMRPARYSV